MSRIGGRHHRALAGPQNAASERATGFHAQTVRPHLRAQDGRRLEAHEREQLAVGRRIARKQPGHQIPQRIQHIVGTFAGAQVGHPAHRRLAHDAAGAVFRRPNLRGARHGHRGVHHVAGCRGAREAARMVRRLHGKRPSAHRAVCRQALRAAHVDQLHIQVVQQARHLRITRNAREATGILPRYNGQLTRSVH